MTYTYTYKQRECECKSQFAQNFNPITFWIRTMNENQLQKNENFFLILLLWMLFPVYVHMCVFLYSVQIRIRVKHNLLFISRCMMTWSGTGIESSNRFFFSLFCFQIQQRRLFILSHRYNNMCFTRQSFLLLLFDVPAGDFFCPFYLISLTHINMHAQKPGARKKDKIQ